MAREQEDQGLLRGCPTCGTKVKDVDLGLRDYRWVNEALPGRIGGMDIDFTINQARTGRVLLLEFKPAGATLSIGARLTFKLFVQKGCDAWVIWDHGDTVEVASIDRDGQLGFIEKMSRKRLADRIRKWWDVGLEGF